MPTAGEIANQLRALFRSDTLDTVESSAAAASAFVRDKLNAPGAADCPAQQAILAAIVDACVEEQVAQTVSTAVLGELTAMLGEGTSDLTTTPGELGVGVRQATLRHLLDKAQQRTSAFESVITGARQALAATLEAEDKWEQAAQQLQAIRFEELQRVYSAGFKFDVYVKTMELFLAAGLGDQAAQSQARVAGLLTQITDSAMIHRYRRVQARIHDLAQRYIEAASAYHTLAQSDLADEAQQSELLERAIRCAVLASAGPQKMRVMSGLYREKRASMLPASGLLEKMVLKRLVQPAELQSFSAQLEPHQRSLLADGRTTVLDHAVREHNIFMLSSLYSNIRFENLGRMLGVGAGEAELMCARMITEGRMKGRIDQIDGSVSFEGAREVKEVAAAILLKSQTAEQPPPMHFREAVAARWDSRIAGLCTAVEDAVDTLIARQPAYATMLFRRAE